MSKIVDIAAFGLAAMTVGFLHFLPQFPLEWGLRSTDICCLIGFAACFGLSMAELAHSSQAKEEIKRGIWTYFRNLAVCYFLLFFAKVWLYYLLLLVWKYFTWTIQGLWNLYGVSVAMPSFSSLPMLFSGAMWYKLGPGLIYGYGYVTMWFMLILGVVITYSSVGALSVVWQMHFAKIFGADQPAAKENENQDDGAPPEPLVIDNGSAE